MNEYVNNFLEGMNFIVVNKKKPHFIHTTCGGILEFFEKVNLTNLFNINLDKRLV